ncbi:hypothetical protein BDBG_06427 [Blastomyces gilchristii SLH14081]|uniref:Nucleotidyltransferase n=1 Tax=Blastomyces gilchristii (strain SLH14081) TaxID=559298 RepID=A0A179UTV9_BLAGS|nr:uncharacterized protein BDBG_06427 [Blastomyces gilchristii SLH14081]OAT10608.1 hypothetical protein BDBG_06427 [Blastomyces gilchristii SLH14081]
MVQQARLNDAAIALHRVLSGQQVKFGIFGGYAVSTLGGPRESKDVDCIASVNKQQILNILDGKNGFVAVPQLRQDYVAFLWSDKPSRERAVLVEIFCEGFPGATFTMADVVPRAAQVTGETQGTGATMLLDPVYLFKGKLRAAATRGKFHDASDLRWLESNYLSRLQQNRGQLSLLYVGLALKRYPELQHCFTRIGVNIQAAIARAAAHDINHLPPPQPGDVQKGLLAPPNT